MLAVVGRLRERELRLLERLLLVAHRRVAAHQADVDRPLVREALRVQLEDLQRLLLLAVGMSWRAAWWIWIGVGGRMVERLVERLLRPRPSLPFKPCRRERVASVVKFSWPPDHVGSETARSAHFSPSARLTLFCAQKFGRLLPVRPVEARPKPRSSLRMLVDPERVDVVDRDRDAGSASSSHFERQRRLRGLALRELVRQPLVVLALAGLRLDAQRVVLGVVPEAAPGVRRPSRR